MEEKNIFKKLGKKAKELLTKIGILKEEPKMLEEGKEPVIVPESKEKKSNPFKEEVKKSAEVPLIDRYNEPKEYVFAYLKEKGLNPKILENPRGRDEVYGMVCEQFKTKHDLGLEEAFNTRKSKYLLESLVLTEGSGYEDFLKKDDVDTKGRLIVASDGRLVNQKATGFTHKGETYVRENKSIEINRYGLLEIKNHATTKSKIWDREKADWKYLRTDDDRIRTFDDNGIEMKNVKMEGSRQDRNGFGIHPHYNETTTMKRLASKGPGVAAMLVSYEEITEEGVTRIPPVEVELRTDKPLSELYMDFDPKNIDLKELENNKNIYSPQYKVSSSIVSKNLSEEQREELNAERISRIQSGAYYSDKYEKTIKEMAGIEQEKGQEIES